MTEPQGTIPINLKLIFDNLFAELHKAKDQEQQNNVQTQILQQILNSTNLTSAYICRWFPKTLQSLVQVEYISEYANHLEQQSDLGEFSTEDLSSFLGRGLMTSDSSPNTASVFNLSLDDPDRQRFLEYGACSVCFAKIWSNDALWGYLEMWESRYERTFTLNEHAIFNYVANKLGEYFANSS